MGDMDNGNNHTMDDCDLPASFHEINRPPLRSIDKHIRAKIPFLSTRHTLAVMTFLGFFVSFGMITNLFIRHYEIYSAIYRFDVIVILPKDIILSYFWGFLLSQISGGFLASFFPSNRIFGAAIFILSICNLNIPWTTDELTNSFLSKLGLLHGMGHGILYITCYAMWRFWSPPLERTTLLTIACSGSYAGVFAGLCIFRFLTRVKWEYSFCFYGTLGILWSIFWGWLIFEKPRCHPTIDVSELQYIENSLGETYKQTMKTKPRLPWTDIVRSKPVIAIVVANVCKSFGFYAFCMSTTWYWSYLIDPNDIYYSLIYLITPIMPLGGILSDHLIKKSTMTTTKMRKLFTCGGLILDALVLFILTTFFSKTIFLVVTLVFINFFVSNCNINFLDIAPQYSIILISLSSGISAAAVLIFASAAQNVQALDGIAICVYLLGATIYCVFASGELERWAEPYTADREVLNTTTEVILEETNAPQEDTTINVTVNSGYETQRLHLSPPDKTVQPEVKGT